MTAEVAILNRSAVAIAADSAVTLNGSDPKVYNTANKLFALSAVEPVAVMIYGAGSFGLIPWDTIVKEYRRELSSSSFETLEEYASKFIEHLSSLVPHIPAKEQRMTVRKLANWELDNLRTAIQHKIQGASLIGVSLSQDEVRAELLDRIESRTAALKEAGYVDGLTASVAGRQINTEINDWAAFVDQSLSNLPVNDEVKQKTRYMVRSSLRVASESPWSSGVVIAGFGTGQLFPALNYYTVDGVIASKVRARHLGETKIGEELSASIRPFAQNDMVATFMDGLDPNYRSALHAFADETIELFSQHFGSQVEGLLSPEDYTNLMTKMKQARLDTAEHFQNQLRVLLEEQTSQPIMSIVGLLPKEELAEMAETLVSLTSFKRRVTPETETVGGPIDVVVISKGDGLVWIKRKHYFTPDLNFRYFDRDRSFRNHTTTGTHHEPREKTCGSTGAVKCGPTGLHPG